MRSTFLYRPEHPLANTNGMVEIRHVDPVEAELAMCGPRHVAIVGDSHYDGTRSPVDGSDISSRRKRREHMRLHGLADFDDFKGVWAKEESRREQVRSGHFDTKERKEAISRAWYEVVEKGRKPKVDTVRKVEVLRGQTRDEMAPVVKVDDMVPNADKGPVKLSGND